MCGICGAVWSHEEHALSESSLSAMTQSLVHRGPDDRGTYRDDHAALGFRRLSILDLEGGHQPLSNEDGSVWVVFNGEIYNFAALRRRLEARGHTLRSLGDTEVLVHLYEDEGVGLFEHLRGMFAMAIWDARRRKLVLGRDRLGQKPLVYHLAPDGSRLLFASELKALAKAGVPRSIDAVALDDYLTYGYIPHPRTIWRGVSKLPPGHCAVWEQGRFALQRYWSPDWNAVSPLSIEEHAEQVRDLVLQAVQEQMIADVPVGAFLSGGIDSTIIVGLMRQVSNHQVKTFSIGFDDPAFDESGYAAMAAKHLGTEHHPFVMAPRAWETLPALAEQFDEPFADSSALPTWEVSRQTREHVTVALTGDAGDELFGGYDRYRALAIASRIDRLPSATRHWLSGPVARAVPASARAKTRLRAAKRWLEALGDPPIARYGRWMTLFAEPQRMALYSPAWLDSLASQASQAQTASEDADPASLLETSFQAAALRDWPSRAMTSDILMYLPGDLLVKVDLASMAHSLECRGPFLDHRVAELAMTIPADQKIRARRGRSKLVLKRAFPDLLPAPIRKRAKMGFGVPLDRWFLGPLREELRSVLLDAQTLDRGLFQRRTVEELVNQHLGGERDNAYRLWGLLMLELWFRHHGDASSK